MQLHYLACILDRILHEATEEKADKINTGTQAPLFERNRQRYEAYKTETIHIFTEFLPRGYV